MKKVIAIASLMFGLAVAANAQTAPQSVINKGVNAVKYACNPGNGPLNGVAEAIGTCGDGNYYKVYVIAQLNCAQVDCTVTTPATYGYAVVNECTGFVEEVLCY